MSFDPKYALNVVLPIAEQAYEWKGTGAIMPGTFGFVVGCHLKTCPTTDGTTTISFRGTEDEDDWLKDFDAEPVASFYSSGMVHRGFQAVYTSVRASVIELTGTNAGPVLITGHSLGGALATICAADYARAGWKPTVYTWASPRVGHGDFATWFGTTVPECYRIRNKWDIVPHTPMEQLGYVHVGQEIRIDGGRPVEDGIAGLHTAHSLEKSYRPGMKKLVTA